MQEPQQLRDIQLGYIKQTTKEHGAVKNTRRDGLVRLRIQDETARAESADKLALDNGTQRKETEPPLALNIYSFNFASTKDESEVFLSYPTCYVEEVLLLIAESNAQNVYAANAWKHSDNSFWIYVLNCLADSLYDVYSSKPTTKALWESLDHKYKIEDARAKKWIVNRFLEFKMVDSKTVISQMQ
ncbi:hypothetical protein AgCh_006435 [Apium graveolens]